MGADGCLVDLQGFKPCVGLFDSPGWVRFPHVPADALQAAHSFGRPAFLQGGFGMVAHLGLIGVLGGRFRLIVAVLAFSTALSHAAEQRSQLVAEYAGTESCKECHEKQYNAFINSHHRKYVQVVTPETVIGDFTKNNVLKVGGHETRMIRRGDEFFVETVGSDGTRHEYRCQKTIGFHYKQRYQTTLADGRLYVLPVQWNRNEQRWVDYHGLAKHKPGSGGYWCDPERAVAVRCAGCHGTGIELRQSKKGFRPKIIEAEMSIGCEACHGPCATHVKYPKQKGFILSLKKLPAQRLVDVCGQCHVRGSDHVAGTAYPYLFRPGDRLLRKFAPVEPTIGKQTKNFWADGRAVKHHQQFIEFIKSSHYTKAGMTCVTCHDPHDLSLGSKPDVDEKGNGPCLSCHSELDGDKPLAAHTHHDTKREGSLCVNCHMPRLISNEQKMQLRHHGMSKPNPFKTIAWGSPNACNICHNKEKETPQQMIDAMKEWGIKPMNVRKAMP